MAQTSAQRTTLFGMLRQEIRKGGKALRASIGRLLTDPQPLVDDLPWWAPQRRRACAITLAVIALFIFGAGIFIRQSDAAHDSPSKFEQAYYLNNSFTLAKDDVTIYTNIFGAKADLRLNTYAVLRRVHGSAGSISIGDTNNNYIKFSPTTVRPTETAIKIAKLPGQRNLQATLQKMADWGFARLTPATKGAGPVYSFDLEMEAFRGPYSLGTFTETFHLRADAIVERSVFWLVIFLAGLAILFVADFTQSVLHYRWRKYFKALAAALTEVLHYLGYAIKIAKKFPDVPPVLNGMLVKLLDEIIKEIIKHLEYFIAKSNDEEAQALRAEALELQQEVMRHKDLPLKTAAELENWKNSLENIIARTEQLRQRTVHLSKQKFRYARVPLTKEALKQAISQTNQTVISGFQGLKGTIIEINQRREDKRHGHEKNKAQRVGEIADRLDGYLDRPHIKSDMDKLGKDLPFEVDPQKLFETPGAALGGEFDLYAGKMRLRCPTKFSFPVTISERPEDQPIWFTIAKKNNDYLVAQEMPDPERKITPGKTTLQITDSHDNTVEIQYTVKVTPEIAQASKRTRDFKIKMSDVALIQPDPNPEQWFGEVPLPEEPKEVKLG